MSGTASVPNTFQNAVTATGLQLDQNYNTVVAYLNDPTNRNNYAADGSATNTVVLTFAPPLVGGYSAGVEITWKWGATNTGGVVVNGNGLGNVALVNPDGSALVAGQGVQGSIGKAAYDGTRFIFLASAVTPATAAQVSAAVTLVPFVSPGRMQNHPGVAKAWGYVTQTAAAYTLASNYNVSSVGRAGTGTVTIVFATAMANTNYAVICSAAGGGNNIVFDITGRTTTSCVSMAFTSNSGAAFDVGFSFNAFGSQ